jgi:hypothetical protein
MVLRAADRDSAAGPATLRGLKEDSMDSEIANLLPKQPHERWFDLCFRLIIVLLAVFWLLMPPAGGETRPTDVRATTATR